ncbi:MAG: hypothetical protein ACI9U2_003759 [Bradymonadia bacterium]|jgi:hypothetical protein
MQRVPRSLRPRICGPLLGLLLLSAGAHAAFWVAAKHAYPQTLVSIASTSELHIVTCHDGFIGLPVAIPEPIASNRSFWPASVSLFAKNGWFGAEREQLRSAYRIHAVFEGHQSDLDHCTAQFADRRRPDRPYAVHIVVEYGRLNVNPITVYTGQPKLRACLQERMRAWADWPMEPDHISVNISRLPRTPD